MNLGGKHFESMDKNNSEEIFPDASEGGFDREVRNRDIWSEEIKELLLKYYPSSSVADKQMRQDLMEKFFDSRSWTKVSHLNSEVLKNTFKLLKAYLEKEAKPAKEPTKGGEKKQEEKKATKTKKD